MGDFAVGKSSLVRRFVSNVFDDRYVSTLGVRVVHQVVSVSGDGEGGALTMMLWDLAGCEELDRGQESYLHGVAGAVLVCDLTRPETLHRLLAYQADLERISPGAERVLAANKHDLLEPPQPGGPPMLTPAEAASTAARLGIPYTVTSAKTGEGVEELFRALARQLLPAP